MMSAIFAIIVVVAAILERPAAAIQSLEASDIQLNYPGQINFNGIEIEEAKIQRRSAIFIERRCFNVTVDVCVPHSLATGWQRPILTSTTTPVPTITDFPISTTDFPSTTTVLTTDFPSTNFPTTTDSPFPTTDLPSTNSPTTDLPSTTSSTTVSPSSTTQPTPTTTQPAPTTTQPVPTTTSTPPTQYPSCLNDQFDCPRTYYQCNNQLQCINTNTGYTVPATRCSSECPSTCPSGSCRQCTTGNSKTCMAPATACTNNLFDCPKRNYNCNTANLTCVNDSYVIPKMEPASACSTFCPRNCDSTACRLCAPTKVCTKSTV